MTLADIGTVDHGVDGECEAETDDGLREGQLASMCAAIPGDVVCGLCMHVLQRKLHMIQARLLEAG